MNVLNGGLQSHRFLLHHSCQPEPHVAPLKLLAMDYLMTSTRLVPFFSSWGKGVSQNPPRGKTALLLRKIKVTHKTICIISGIRMPSLEVYDSQVTNPYTRLWQIKTWINVKILTNQVYLLGKNKNKEARQTWVLIQVLSFASCVRLEKSSCLSQPQFPPL